MQYPIVINSRGKAGKDNGNWLFNQKSLREIQVLVNSWNLVPQNIMMNEEDYKDIIAWSKDQ